MLQINDLNDDCLFGILYHFSVGELITTIRFVCYRWRSLVDKLLRSKSSFYIFGSLNDFNEFNNLNIKLKTNQLISSSSPPPPASLESIQYNSIILNELNNNSIVSTNCLPLLLPNIVYLTIFNSSNIGLDLPQLLSPQSGWNFIINLTIVRCSTTMGVTIVQQQQHQVLKSLKPLTSLDPSFSSLSNKFDNRNRNKHLQLFGMYLKEVSPKLLDQLECLGFRFWILVT